MITYLCIFLKFGRTAFIALNVHANGGATAACAAQTVNDARAVREDDTDALRAKHKKRHT